MMLSTAKTLLRCQYATRGYATVKPSEHLSPLARIARTASTPLAVRLRRRKQFGELPQGASDATESGMTPTERARYDRLVAKGRFTNQQGIPMSPEEWIANVNQRRSRVRGLVVNKENGRKRLEAVGRRVYLPNIVMRMVRNQTAPGQPYNPYEATFRIPQSVTKTDVRALLDAVYGVKTTYIRTDNYISPLYRTPQGTKERRAYRTYKRAVVGLVEPFYYPQRLEDMPAKEREEREEWIEQHFAIQDTRNLQKEELLRMTKGQGRMSWKFNAPYATKRSHILRLVNERRDKREALVSEFAQEIRTLKKRDAAPTYGKVRGSVKGRESMSEETTSTAN